ncbi:MAG: hypothetical protein OEZ58_19110 [Gammaproteobacteria bacterium]|nr:hypothetical protein [Gammaproteobacteria bacterium]MDH5731098.1 hypothetical protein [Gammaproteobacteria bacterium]
MTDVFISRPTWIADSFQAGLDGFLGMIQNSGLNPRTLGSTDYPAQSPLEEVIRIMRECHGAIILGYPQIHIDSGSVKGEPIKEQIILGTEWNHIEAGLAHASGLPMLIIHHTGVGRGIFDRGTLGRFIYEVNLERPEWPLAQNINGAMRTWRQSLLETPPETNGENSQNQNNQAEFELNEIEVQILQLLADGNGVSLPAKAISHLLNQQLTRIEYHLERLSENDFIYFPLIMGQEAMYEIDQRGRAYLIERDLL